MYTEEEEAASRSASSPSGSRWRGDSEDPHSSNEDDMIQALESRRLEWMEPLEVNKGIYSHPDYDLPGNR